MDWIWPLITGFAAGIILGGGGMLAIAIVFASREKKNAGKKII